MLPPARLPRSRLGAAPRACARGIHPLEVGTGLLVDCGSWLHREDFTSRFITTGTSISDGVTLLASTNWEAAITALHAGDLPASGGERRMLLLAASIAGGIPVSLYDTLPELAATFLAYGRERPIGLLHAVTAPARPTAARRLARRTSSTPEMSAATPCRTELTVSE